MRSLAKRNNSLELMDLGDYSAAEFEQCLRQLKLINILTNGYRPTVNAVATLARKHRTNDPLRILDIGYGYGDTLREIAIWARKNRVAVDLTGLDLNPLSQKIAKAATPAEFKINFLVGDIFLHMPEKPYDICTNALMMHHLTDDQIVKLVEWMNINSKLGFFSNDLHRSLIAYNFIKYFTRIFRFNRLILNDAPLSVARSFCRDDWNNYFKKANLDPAQLKIKWQWAFRYGILYEKL